MRKFILAGLLLLPIFAAADERILNFHSDILVFESGWIEVTETITVRAEGQRIRRGIYRDFPTRYRDLGQLDTGSTRALPFGPGDRLRIHRPRNQTITVESALGAR